MLRSLVGSEMCIRDSFWDARMKAGLKWYANWDKAQRNKGIPALIEKEGSWTFSLGERTFTLSARADRIDKTDDGGAHIIDYKTGTPPTLDQIKTKFSPQLPLTGFIVREGGFKSLETNNVAAIEYLRVLNRKNDEKDDVGEKNDPNALIDDAKDGFLKLLQHFENPTTSYPSQPRAQYSDQYSDYDHLARRRERHAQGGDE